MRGPLAVRAWAPGGDRHLPAQDLTFTKTAPGGHSSTGFKLPLWVTADDPALAPLARVKVYDTRTGATVFGAAYLDMPGRTVGEDGHTWDVGAIGGTSLLADRALAHIVVARNLEDWKRTLATDHRMTAQVGTDPADENVDGLILTWPQGIPVDVGSRITMRNRLLDESGQTIGAIQITHHEGGPSTNNQVELLATTGPGGQTLVRSADWATTSDTIGASAGGILGVGNNRGAIRIRRVSGTAKNIDTELFYAVITDALLMSLRKNQAGADLTDAASYPASGTVTADQVIVDALWRFTTMVDTANADIGAGTYAIDQFAYPDPVRLADLLADLALFEPAMYHYVGASDDVTGLHSFAYRGWGSGPRYEADTVDGWSQPGGESDLCNRIMVAWTDKAGRAQATVASITVPALNALGRVRDAEPAEIGRELGSAAAANRIGQRLLEEAVDPPVAGTLTVARPIRDLTTGRMVLPHEIEPGYKVAVRDIDLTLPCTEVTYRDSDQSATLTLGRPVLSREQLLLRTSRQRRRRR